MSHGYGLRDLKGTGTGAAVVDGVIEVNRRKVLWNEERVCEQLFGI